MVCNIPWHLAIIIAILLVNYDLLSREQHAIYTAAKDHPYLRLWGWVFSRLHYATLTFDATQSYTLPLEAVSPQPMMCR